MYPWIWLWAPQLHFPWSGSVAQRIEPDTNWFFAGIPARSGDGEVEKRAFEVASYGRQLGLITEVVLGLATKDAVSPECYAESVQRLKDIRKEIEGIKDQEAAASLVALADALQRLRVRQPEQFRLLMAGFADPAQGR